MIEEMNCEAERQPKHIELHDAIQGMKSISRELDALIEQIEGPRPQPPANLDPSNVKAPTPQPQLVDILNSGADSIRSYQDEAMKRIEDVRSLLF